MMKLHKHRMSEVREHFLNSFTNSEIINGSDSMTETIIN